MELRVAEFYLFKKARVNVGLNPESAPLFAMSYLSRRLLASSFA
jgi:hypothetical protein